MTYAQPRRRADLAVLEHYGDARRLLAAGKARLTRLIAKASHNHSGADKAEAFLAAARHAAAREAAYQQVEADGLTRTLPGVAEVGGSSAAHPSPPSRPRISSPNAGRSPNTSAPSDGPRN